MARRDSCKGGRGWAGAYAGRGRVRSASAESAPAQEHGAVPGRKGAMVGATAVALVGAAAMVGMAAMGAAAGAAATSDVLLLLVVDSGGVVYLLTYTFAFTIPCGGMRQD